MQRPIVHPDRFDRYAAPAAAALCLAAALGFGAAFAEYSHLRHPLALLGARGVPRALAFDLLAFALPGAVAAVVALRLRERLPGDAGYPARLGTWLLAISALAWAAQGLLPLDPYDLDGAAGQRHAAAWMLWWLAFVPAAWLLAWGLRRCAGWRAVALSLSAAGAAAVALNAVPSAWLPGPAAQRLVALLWWGCLIAVSRRR
ncbi:DUF998 domain-containing protein [Vulcaniibacterium tengchongense]|uniref:Uncharacterized protein DUF998 n=1 Tax=Vulcaniibacterium tengchongense TaxID=1273429 RepID=A0A3N4VW85_9GAMM|nr:DUF998 domain-containing protein [Vulcaniibacterium tengchongense]RPE81317.1 uncharacterized protein DUF998 [Vulcaniibacterium tengchongense]